MSCPHIPGCGLFPQFTLQPMLELWKSRYCHAQYERCARYQLSARGETVPPTLLPNGRLLLLRRTGEGEGVPR